MPGRTYGRGAGERPFRPIPVIKSRIRRRPVSILYDEFHAAYPQTGAYAVSEHMHVSDSGNNGEDRP